MSRKISYLIAGIILILSITVAIILVAQRPETALQEAPSRAPFVSTVPVVSGSGVIPIYGAGTVRPKAEVSVTAQVSGQVVWVNPAFQSGGRVLSGVELFRIDDADYLSQVNRAQANVAAQEVELMRVTAEAKIAGIQFEQWNRQDSTESQSALALWEPQIKAAQAALNRDMAELNEAELRLSRTIIESPFSAAVLDESIAVGQFVSAGQSVGRIYAVNVVEVVVSLPDERATLIPNLWNLRPGINNRSVSANVMATYAGGRYVWRGYVDRAEAALEQQTRTIEVVIAVPNPFRFGLEINESSQSTNAPPLLIGKFVDVEIDGSFPGEFFKIRRSALRADNEVWVVQDETLHRIAVQILQRSEDEVYVTGALEEGQQIVVSGLRTAIDGMSVRTGS